MTFNNSVRPKFPSSSYGFAVVETLVVVVMAVAIGGTGYYVFQHRHDEAPVADSSLSSPLGTTAQTDEIEQQEMNQEASVNTQYDQQQQTSATTDNAALANLGGASDDSSL